MKLFYVFFLSVMLCGSRPSFAQSKEQDLVPNRTPLHKVVPGTFLVFQEPVIFPGGKREVCGEIFYVAAKCCLSDSRLEEGDVRIQDLGVRVLQSHVRLSVDQARLDTNGDTILSFRSPAGHVILATCPRTDHGVLIKDERNATVGDFRRSFGVNGTYRSAPYLIRNAEFTGTEIL